MKTYDLYGTLSRASAPVPDSNTTKVALDVQRALGVEMLARADDPRPYAHYSHAEYRRDAARQEFVVSNVPSAEAPAPYPEFDDAIIVGIDEPVDPHQTRAALEAVGLRLLRRRRREYAAPHDQEVRPSLDVYGTSTGAAATTATLQRRLDMPFDGNEHVAVGGDSHYYGESERFGSILVFDNVSTAFDDAPFRQYSDVRAVVIVVNSRAGRELRQLLFDCGFQHLESAIGSEHLR
ncbi:MAG TPA: hypothetical protein VF218_08220 [Acidothermaceae bacterium]|jgi:hypothetical protein